MKKITITIEENFVVGLNVKTTIHADEEGSSSTEVERLFAISVSKLFGEDMSDYLAWRRERAERSAQETKDSIEKNPESLNGTYVDNTGQLKRATGAPYEVMRLIEIIRVNGPDDIYHKYYVEYQGAQYCRKSYQTKTVWEQVRNPFPDMPIIERDEYGELELKFQRMIRQSNLTPEHEQYLRQYPPDPAVE